MAEIIRSSFSSPMRRKRGRPKVGDTVLVRIRLSIAAYDAYCRQARRHEPNDGERLTAQGVRAVLRRVLEARLPDTADLTPQEARTIALRLLLVAEDLERTDARGIPVPQKSGRLGSGAP